MPDFGILTPGLGDGDLDDLVLVRAMIRAEVAWVEATGTAQESAAVSEAAAALSRDELRLEAIARGIAIDAMSTGNPVIGLVRALRAEVPAATSDSIHRGLTSQDIVDTAIMLTLREASGAIEASLQRTCASLERLAVDHRSTPVLAYTLGQAALPTTFGARVAGWLNGVGEAKRQLAALNATTPIAYGGAVGNLGDVPLDAIDTWATLLGLAVPVAPWHVHRSAVTRRAGALAEVCAELGVLASHVLAGVRPEVGELAEPSAPGRGASSAMPFKSNPILSILIRRSAIAAPHMLAQVTSAAGLATDERPDGAWHAEWEPLRGLARHAVVASRCAAQLVEGLTFNADAAARNLAAFSPQAASVGSAELFVDRVVAQHTEAEK